MHWFSYCRCFLFLILTVTLLGCQSADYYSQAAMGHFRIMLAKRPIPELLADPATPRGLRDQLSSVLVIREFARRELLLPTGGSYRDFVDLGRPQVAWNVFAAPELSLALKSWCYPIAGCSVYRGYFDETEAAGYAAELRREGYDTVVSGVTAYSTLGWFDDPVLSTFLNQDKAHVAALLFHELAHRQLYVPGDSLFNESFATAVEEEGLRRWAEASGESGLLSEYNSRRQLTDQFVRMVSARIRDLEAVYSSELSVTAKKDRKEQILADLRSDYEAARRREPRMGRYERWFVSGLNNAGLAALATYQDLVPGFRCLLAQSGGDLAAFYETCRRLAGQPIPERHAHLRQPPCSP